MDDADCASQAATAQLDLARAQFDQARARLEELQHQSGQHRDPLARRRVRRQGGAWIRARGSRRTRRSSRWSTSSFVRLVANVVEKDLRRVAQGTPARCQVDAYPGETFAGRVARVAPVLDPATRTAQIEVEVPNRDFRLKPGMYARVQFTVERRPNALVVPTNALVIVQRQARACSCPAAGQDGQVPGRSRPASSRATSPRSRRGCRKATASSRPAPRRCGIGDRILLAGQTAAARARPEPGRRAAR